jgi:hypothetical protein
MNASLRIDKIVVHWVPDEDGERRAEGCYAVAEVSYACSPSGDRRLEWLKSGGLWDIDGATGEYRAEIAQEQIADLRAHLEALGIDVSTFDAAPRDVSYR